MRNLNFEFSFFSPPLEVRVQVKRFSTFSRIAVILKLQILILPPFLSDDLIKEVEPHARHRHDD